MKLIRKPKSIALLLVAAVLYAVATPAFGHHSVSMFDMTKTVTLEGTITEVDWANPHSLVFFDAKPVDKEAAPVRNWSVQLMAPNALVALGWQKDSIKVGDKVTVKGYPRKDSRPQILFIELNDKNGHHFVMKTAEYDKFK